MDIRVLTPEFSAAPQITVDDVAEIAKLGYKTLICNRPDGEVPGQPLNADIEAAAKDAGLAFHCIAFAGMITPDMLAAFDEALDKAERPVLAFCRTGTRSTNIWSLSQSRHTDADDLIEAAAKGGYDVSPMRGMFNERRA